MGLFDKLLGRNAPAGGVNLGDLRRLTPISAGFGQDRGTTIRRHYIAQFLESNRSALAGRVMEIGDDRYARAFAAPTSTIDILDPSPSNVRATICGDLVTGEGVPTAAFDAIILTQVLHVIYDIRAAISIAHQALKPGGSVLATIPAITQVSRFDMDRWGDYWRMTDLACQRLFSEVFVGGTVETVAYGNHLTAIASLSGLAAQDLNAEELAYHDPDFQVLIGVRATRGRE